ncbi:MAG: GDSL family lipase [Clostridiales bacterium]|nr:GDSL family lipase [Clostridiales bacterium]
MRITPNWHNVKPLGRTWPLEDGLWLALSASGAEFTFTGSACEVTIAGDNRAADAEAVNDHARIALYLDGQRAVDTLLNAPVKVFTLEAGEGEHTVRIVKLSETAMSTCVIRTIEAEDIRPTAKKLRLVEFIGDSITCGYGVDDEDPEHHFTTATEDTTRAYAYRTAQALDVDVSLVSISGYGIISGYTATAEEPVTAQLLPTYYEKLGFSYGAYKSQAPQDVRWDFTVRQPDLVVINLGTNDDSYCRDYADRQQHYCDQYADFLRTVRRCNPGAKILCTLGLMGDRLYPFVEKAAAAYSAETGDTNIACMPFVPQLAEDGLAADYHPTEATHRKAAEKLTAEIRRLMGW